MRASIVKILVLCYCSTTTAEQGEHAEAAEQSGGGLWNWSRGKHVSGKHLKVAVNGELLNSIGIGGEIAVDGIPRGLRPGISTREDRTGSSHVKVAESP